MLHVKAVGKDDDLSQIASEINCAQWDDANEMSKYDAQSLSAYLDHQGTIFLACYEQTGSDRSLVGISSSRLEIKPYGHERWLYIDEIDVCANQRRRGAGKAMMKKLLEIAKELNCEEVWLGTEVDNLAANALYRSMNPDDILEVIGYTYETAE
ncbi:MAG: GNAT family N-acetyltransferase [Burkholderiaceae bacterium]